MGKNKRQKFQSSTSKKPKTAKFSKPAGISKTQAQTKQPKQTNTHTQTQHSAPTIPFSPSDRILLIGEGDLSFARALVEHHACAHVVATVYESREELEGKYPQVRENLRVLEEKSASVRFGVDVMKVKGKAGLGGVGREGVQRVVFNFPHVGGKSTDVNRQVRYNQELLLAFFKHALPCLAQPTSRSPSSIIVTLFEGEPYTLWNIRDVARSAGLAVEKSFKFQASAYPGYRHARTLGVVKGKNGEIGGGWKGEERPARTFVFVRRGEETAPGVGGKKKGDSSDDDEEDNEDEQSDFEGWVKNGDNEEHGEVEEEDGRPIQS